MKTNHLGRVATVEVTAHRLSNPGMEFFGVFSLSEK
jgi:hypothetical protein